MKNSHFWSASAKFSKLQHWYSTRGPIPTLSCLKNYVTEVLASCFCWRPNCTNSAIILGTLIQMWWILVSMISTIYHMTSVFNTRWNFDHNNPNSFIEKRQHKGVHPSITWCGVFGSPTHLCTTKDHHTYSPSSLDPYTKASGEG
jgi:hypothetical protein